MTESSDPLLLQALQRLGDDVGAIRGAFDKLRDEQIEARTDIDQLMKERDQDRKFKVGVIMTVLGVVLTALGGFIEHLAEHVPHFGNP